MSKKTTGEKKTPRHKVMCELTGSDTWSKTLQFCDFSLTISHTHTEFMQIPLSAVNFSSCVVHGV